MAAVDECYWWRPNNNLLFTAMILSRRMILSGLDRRLNALAGRDQTLSPRNPGTKIRGVERDNGDKKNYAPDLS